MGIINHRKDANMLSRIVSDRYPNVGAMRQMSRDPAYPNVAVEGWLVAFMFSNSATYPIKMDHSRLMSDTLQQLYCWFGMLAVEATLADGSPANWTFDRCKLFAKLHNDRDPFCGFNRDRIEEMVLKRMIENRDAMQSHEYTKGECGFDIEFRKMDEDGNGFGELPMTTFIRWRDYIDHIQRTKAHKGLFKLRRALTANIRVGNCVHDTDF